MNILDNDELFDAEICDVDFSDMSFSGKALENCTFRHCTFTNTKLINSKLEKIKFVSCNISNIDLTQTFLVDAEFTESKIVGLALYKCKNSIFDLIFTQSKLEYCNFSDIHMKKSIFDRCEIIETYFQNTFLPESRFNHTSFTNTLFNKCDLSKADFCGSDGYVIDPRDCKVKQAQFSFPGVLGLLDVFGIKIQTL